MYNTGLQLVSLVTWSTTNVYAISVYLNFSAQCFLYIHAGVFLLDTWNFLIWWYRVKPGPKTYADMKVIHINVCSLKDKTDSIAAELSKYDVWVRPGWMRLWYCITWLQIPLRCDTPARGDYVLSYVKNWNENLLTGSMHRADKSIN